MTSERIKTYRNMVFQVIGQYVTDPIVPKIGDTVTVASLDAYQAPGHRQQVIGLDEQYAGLDGSLPSFQDDSWPPSDAKVTLAYIDDYGHSRTQVVPLYVLRPYVEPPASVNDADDATTLAAAVLAAGGKLELFAMDMARAREANLSRAEMTHGKGVILYATVATELDQQ